jgi:Bax protein
MFKVYSIWSKRIVLTSLFAMVAGLYIAVGTHSACADEKAAAPKTETPKEEVKESTEGIKVSNADHLKKVFKENGMNLDKAVASEKQVPRTFIANFPQDMPKIKDRKTKNDLFVGTLLPMILHENEIIMQERKQLISLKKAVSSGKTLKHHEQYWLKRTCEKYKMKKVDFDELLRRADIIPPSLALGQAVIESGTGTSYAAVKKNSPFGMTVSQKVLRYKDLKQSVSKYMCNLNYNNAYRTMRKTRAELRKTNKNINGNALIGDMVAYCEFKNYIGKVRSAIKSNNLMKYDDINLAPKDTA